MAREKILVIGASGFVGAHLFNQLKHKGELVIGTTTRKGFWREEYVEGDLLELDISSDEHLKKFLHRERPSIIINLAAYGNHFQHLEDDKIFEVNVHGLLGLLRYLENFPETKLINIGSSSEYGENVDGADETYTPMPNSLYGISKYQASQMIKYFGDKKQLDCVHLRLFSVYGALEDPTRFIPKLIHMAKFKKLPLLSPNQTSRDFIHVDDVIQCIFRCLEKKHHGDSYNVCTGKKWYLTDVAELIKEVADINEEVLFSKEAARSWEVKEWWGKTEKAEKYLGFKSEISLKTGLTNLLLGYQDKNKQLYNKELQKISIIVACYEDEKHIPVLYERTLKVFKTLEYQYEIIFVNDGSKDKSVEIIQSISANDSFVTGINHLRNFGSQAAFLSGLSESCGTAFIFMDGDLQDPPELIPQLIKKWEKGAKVVGARRVGRVENVLIEKGRKLFYRLLKFFSLDPIHLDVGEFALMDKSIAQKLLAMKDHSPFVRIMRSYIGEKYDSVDYIRPERMFGNSTNNMIKNFWWVLHGLFSTESKIPYAIFLVSLFCFFTGMLFWSFQLDRLFILLILLFLGLLQFQMTYLLRAARGRPLYLIKNKIIRGKVIG